MELAPERAEILLESLADAVVVANRDGVITGWHGAAQRLFGFTPAQVVGRPVTDLFPDAPARAVEELGTLGGAASVDLVLPVRLAAGGTLLTAVTVRPLVVAGEPAGTVALFKPMAAAFDPAQDLDRHRVNPEWDRTLGRIVRELIEVAASDPGSLERTDALAAVLVAQGRRMLPDAEVALSLVPHDRQDRFRIIAGAGPWAESQVGLEWPRAGTVAGLAMHVRRPIETVRLRERSSQADRLEAGSVTTGRLVPLYTPAALPDGREAIGVMGFYRTTRRYFTPWERRLAGEFCRLASLMLQGAELRAAMLRSTEQLATTIEAAQAFTRSLAADDLLRALIDVALGAGADRVTVLRVEDGESTVLAGVDRDAGAAVVGRRVPVTAARSGDGTPIVARALELNRMLTCTGYHVEGIDTVPFAQVRHAVVMPVAGVGRGSVVLVFARRDEDSFAADDLGMLQTAASIAGVALRNAWLYSEVQEAGRVKTDFLNMAAHELRTPLTVIRGYLSMLDEGSFGPAPGAFREPLRMLLVKTDELGRLVDDLLLAARLDTGRVLVNLGPVDLNETVRLAAERVRPRARAAGADLRVERARRPVVVAADPEHLAHVLDALLANALSYPGALPPRVRVRVGAGGGRGRIEVEDRGRGIPAADRERVFERFVRVEDARYPQQPGTGLGLHIARELARRQGGEVDLVWSEPDAGARFAVDLPLLERGPDD